jgi:hypothetical protein
MNKNIRALTENELDELYGGKKIDANNCFKSENHYYMQRENDVLHCNNETINSLHVGFLNNEKFKKISKKEFDLKIKEIIYHLEIDNYFNKK